MGHFSKNVSREAAFSGASPKFVSPSLDWLAWLGLASLASAWRVSSAAATTTATTPEEAATTTAAARSAATVLTSASSGLVAVFVAAAEETRHAEARQAKPSQASQSREGFTNGIGYICDEAEGLPDHETANIRQVQ